MSAWNDSSSGGGAGGPATPPPGSAASMLTKAEKSPDSDSEDLTDAEGVWSPDIEQSFQEALAIYPPCGRRKIILSDEGKMYGRNELIARYIKLRTGKSRTRKQVSSHIQVLARRKSKEIQSHLKDQTTKERALQQLSCMSSSQIVSASAMHNKMAAAAAAVPPAAGPAHADMPLGASNGAEVAPATAAGNDVSMTSSESALPHGGPHSQFWSPAGGISPQADVKPLYGTPNYPMDKQATSMSGDMPPPAWQGRSIAGSKLRLVEFSAYLEQQRDQDTYHKHLFVHISSCTSYTEPLLEAVDIRQIYDKFPEKKGGLKENYDKGPIQNFYLVKFWADLNANVEDETGSYYGINTQYESTENMPIVCSTKVCSFGKQVVEKVETEFPRFENGRFVYRIMRSPMCEYMINFIHKLKHLPEKYMMNSVLENFTILQIVSNRDTQETLLCIAYVFEVSTSAHGAQHHIYRLVKD